MGLVILIILFPTPILSPTIEIAYNSLFLDGRYVSPYLPNTAVYGALTGPESELYMEVWVDYPELFDIITCESGWRSKVCNKEYGCQSGMGLAQFIPTTWDHIKSKGVKVADPFNVGDNLTAAIWLYTNEGSYHWSQSESCWSKQ